MNLSIIRASRGMYSQMSRPGTFVGIGLYSPRMPVGGLGLQIKHVLVRWPAGQEDHDDRLVRPCDPRLRFGLQHLGQRKPPSARPPILRKSRRVTPSQ